MDVSVEEYYLDLDQWLRGIKGMNLARWKLLQNTLISLLVALLSLEAGADPTVAIGVIAIINGLSLADLATVWSGGGVKPPQQNKKPKKRQQNGDKETERR